MSRHVPPRAHPVRCSLCFLDLSVSFSVLRMFSAIISSQPFLSLFYFWKWKWKSLSHVQLFATPWTIHSMEFSRPEYWSVSLRQGNLPNPGIEPRSPILQTDSLPTELSGKPYNTQQVSFWNPYKCWSIQYCHRGLWDCLRFFSFFTLFCGSEFHHSVF